MQIYKWARNKKYKYTLNSVQLVRGGKEYFDVITTLIYQAQDTIHLLTYIFEADDTGQGVADALLRATARNVKVYMLVDGYASQALPTTFIATLLEGGIRFRFFEPVFKSKNFYFGRRLHSKVLVVDSRIALLGGVNITDRYNDLPGKPAWLDFALRAEGPVAIEACDVCWKLWRGFQPQKAKPPCVPFPELMPDAAFKSLVRLRRNDWVRNKLQISNSYLEMFRTARSHIVILSSYALPGNLFRKNLQRAVRRGVKVTMIISGQSDVPFVKQAERYWYDWLVRNHIEIYEYTKNVLHGKLAICDDERMTIGSYNVNDLSAYASIELNFDVADPEFVRQVHLTLDEIIAKDCVKVSREELARSRNILTRFGRWVSYNLIRASFNLFTFYYRQQKSDDGDR
jgi:cardiolipin synthase